MLSPAHVLTRAVWWWSVGALSTSLPQLSLLATRQCGVFQTVI
jgi:hypothetical protein